MANQTADTNSVASIVAEFQNRAKAAQETLASQQAEWVKFSNDNIEAIKASGEILAAGIKPIAEEAVASTRRQFDAVRETVTSMADVKSPAELIKLQQQAAEANLSALLSEGEAFRASVAKLAADTAAPIVDRVAAITKLAA